MLRIALVGDRDDRHVAHRALPEALRPAGAGRGTPAAAEWVATDAIVGAFSADAHHGVRGVPASPYRSEAGALAAIRAAREGGVPFLGTCGGFQHAVLEFARGVLGLAGAGHAEHDPGAAPPAVTPLACALLGAAGRAPPPAAAFLAAAAERASRQAVHR